MIVVVDLTIPASSFMFPDTLPEHPAVELELVELVPTGEHPVPYCWVAGSDRSVAAFAEAVETTEKVATMEPLDRGDSKVLYRIEWRESPCPLLGALRTHEILVDRAVGAADGWDLRLQCPDHQTLSTFREDCLAHGVDLTVERVFRPSAADDSEPLGLTPEQREALLLAQREDYFEVPRGITLEELGTMLGISRQAVSNRLRRGTSQLVDRLVDRTPE